MESSFFKPAIALATILGIFGTASATLAAPALPLLEKSPPAAGERQPHTAAGPAILAAKSKEDAVFAARMLLAALGEQGAVVVGDSIHQAFLDLQKFQDGSEEMASMIKTLAEKELEVRRGFIRLTYENAQAKETRGRYVPSLIDSIEEEFSKMNQVNATLNNGEKADWRLLGTNEESVKTLKVRALSYEAFGMFQDVLHPSNEGPFALRYYERGMDFLEQASRIKGSSIGIETVVVTAKDRRKIEDILAKSREIAEKMGREGSADKTPALPGP